MGGDGDRTEDIGVPPAGVDDRRRVVASVTGPVPTGADYGAQSRKVGKNPKKGPPKAHNQRQFASELPLIMVVSRKKVSIEAKHNRLR